MSSVAWVLILLCAANFISISAHEDSEVPRSKDFLISSKNLSLSDLQDDGFITRRVMTSENINLTEKAQRGKGAYGGANLVHRRPGEKSGAARLYESCFFISPTILGFWFLPFLFHYF